MRRDDGMATRERRGGAESGCLLPIGAQPGVDQSYSLIDYIGPHALLRRDGLHQAVHPFDMGRTAK
jgi:hypothetical protein